MSAPSSAPSSPVISPMEKPLTLKKLKKERRTFFRRNVLEKVQQARYHRICALFESAVDQAKHSERAARFRELREEIRSIEEGLIEVGIDKDGLRQNQENFIAYFGHKTHQLNLMLNSMLPTEFLEGQLDALEGEFTAVWANQEASQPVIATNRERLQAETDGESGAALRSYTLFLINDIRRLYVTKLHIADLQSALLEKLGGATLKMAVLSTAAIILSDVLRSAPSGQNRAYFLGVMGCATGCGALGACLSAALRIQQVSDNINVARLISKLEGSLETISTAPLTGTISAGLLCLFWVSGLVGGSLLPNNFPNPWVLMLFDWKTMALLSVWSFAAGFTERLLPDTIDTIIGRNKSEK